MSGIIERDRSDWTSNGLPEWKPYAYQGTGFDQLPHLTDADLEPYRADEKTWLAPCGTEAAYRRHLRRRELPCEACRQANQRKVDDYQRARRQRDQETAS